jgi:hypothetical protein
MRELSPLNTDHRSSLAERAIDISVVEVRYIFDRVLRKLEVLQQRRGSTMSRSHIRGPFSSPVSQIRIPSIMLIPVPTKKANPVPNRPTGDRTTLRQVASVFNTSLNCTDVMPGQMSELRTGLGRIMESGMADVFMKPLPNSILGSAGGKVHDEMEKSNDLWEGHAFLTVADLHGKKSAGI